jgi:anti-sigma B factor antagonist
VSDIAGVRVEDGGRIVRAWIDGELDLSNTREVAGQLIERVPNAAFGLLLDLSELDYLDSTGVQMLFELVERLQSRQQKLVVVVPPESTLQRVLRVVAIGETVPVVESTAAGEAELS